MPAYTRYFPNIFSIAHAFGNHKVIWTCELDAQFMLSTIDLSETYKKHSQLFLLFVIFDH